MASCVSDSVILDQTRFVDKVKDKAPEQLFEINNLQFESAKKMVEFSYSMQEQLAQQELDRLSSIIKINFETPKEKEQIMKDFFLVQYFQNKKFVKDEKITQSPIVRLEYLKTKYPELVEIDLEAFKTKKQSLRRQQFEERTREIGIGENQVLTLDQLLQQQIIENDLELEISHDIKK